MEVEETKSHSGYGKPPWIFKGSALYQLHLVKAEIARAIIPKEFRLVEVFGYTLGGFFLANYEDSPVGSFDELVVIAGIVWNPPTSHAWAARVYVNNDEACSHGRKEFGLPSQVVTFSKVRKAMLKRPKTEINGLLSSIDVGTNCSDQNQKNDMDIQIAEINGSLTTGLYNIGLSSSKEVDKIMGAAIKMSLPSFSGHTEYNPHLLKYSCQIECRVRPTSPARVLGLSALGAYGLRSSSSECLKLMESCNGEIEEGGKRNLSVLVMLSKPILALEFNCLRMQVESPVIVSKGSHHS